MGELFGDFSEVNYYKFKFCIWVGFGVGIYFCLMYLFSLFVDDFYDFFVDSGI